MKLSVSADADRKNFQFLKKNMLVNYPYYYNLYVIQERREFRNV